VEELEALLEKKDREVARLSQKLDRASFVENMDSNNAHPGLVRHA
jgi:hypothetical protein